MKIEYFKIENKKESTMHIVKPLETYEKIAKIYSVDEIKLKNTNNNEKLFIGKKIVIK